MLPASNVLEMVSAIRCYSAAFWKSPAADSAAVPIRQTQPLRCLVSDAGRSKMLKEIRLAQGHARIAKNGIGGRDMEKEIGEREAGQILAAGEAITHPVREGEDDFAIFTSD